MYRLRMYREVIMSYRTLGHHPNVVRCGVWDELTQRPMWSRRAPMTQALGVRTKRAYRLMKVG